MPRHLSAYVAVLADVSYQPGYLDTGFAGLDTFENLLFGRAVAFELIGH
jgi:hypothetical protein